MTHPNPSTALARVVIDELVVGGVRFVAVSPGSRSGALAIAASQHPELETRVIIDERSAAFWALGIARASGRPAAVLCTSGTALANFFPAIIEADMSGVPLVAVSADRPEELRGVGANQTIDQVNLFGPKVRAYRGIEAPEVGIDANEAWRSAVSGLVGAATGAPMPGPVHLNVAFREPTVPVADDGRTAGATYEFPTPRLETAATPAEPGTDSITDLNLDAGMGIVIAGDGEYDRLSVEEHAGRLGWPILATALSGMRGGGVVSAYRFLLDRGVPDPLRPESVVAIGSIGPDPSLERLVDAARVRIRVDRWGRHIDPGRNATKVLAADPVEVLSRVDGSGADGWAKKWREADAEVRSRVVAAIESRSRTTGGVVAHAVNRVDRGALVVASSLPIREVDAHLTTRGPIFANRGASGIDGFISTALGVASVIPRTVAVAGDLSLLHDANGFLSEGETDLTLIVIDNGGGGLFDSLPQARHAPDFERLFITPPGRDPVELLRFHRARTRIVSEPAKLVPALDSALDRPGLDAVVVPVDRRYDLEARSQSYS
ncbi:MAG TPA: 2-succinyl-5-enolpyruvyl-6-hydroxy-3-cyclohexene-1-carboxylic-acid synthase [Acidimicrobiia bacterium]|nr:2-succinyl-5-enolpyruvyl-6-hydroxy-3-cyclohexene-1-carboxylic-acid synthase [Acidimicrobiia bacterium]